FLFTEFGAVRGSIPGCNVHKLVHSAECRGVLGCGKRGTDAKSIDLSSAGKQIGDDEFVEVAAGEDAGLCESCLIKAETHLAREVHQIATVQADALGGGRPVWMIFSMAARVS